MADKPKLALYWASSCGGCEIAVLALHEKILEVAEAFDIVFWPCVLDFKKSDVEALADGEITVTLFNGAIRTDENEEMAHLLRRKSQVMVAFGSCATEGCRFSRGAAWNDPVDAVGDLEFDQFTQFVFVDFVVHKRCDQSDNSSFKHNIPPLL